MTDMERMQKEAVNSARAMYRRRTPVRQTVQTEVPEQGNSDTEASVKDTADTQAPESEIQHRSVFSTLFEDKERTLIILLIILLSEDNSDPGAVLALMYCLF